MPIALPRVYCHNCRHALVRAVVVLCSKKMFCKQAHAMDYCIAYTKGKKERTVRSVMGSKALVILYGITVASRTCGKTNEWLGYDVRSERWCMQTVICTRARVYTHMILCIQRGGGLRQVGAPVW